MFVVNLMGLGWQVEEGTHCWTLTGTYLEDCRIQAQPSIYRLGSFILEQQNKDHQEKGPIDKHRVCQSVVKFAVMFQHLEDNALMIRNDHNSISLLEVPLFFIFHVL